MQNLISSIFRWIVFILLSFIITILIGIGIYFLTLFLLNLNLSVGKIIFLFIFIGLGTFFLMPMLLSGLMGLIMSFICPNRDIGIVVFSVVSIFSYLYLLITLWSIPDSYPLSSVLILILLSILVIIICVFSIIGMKEDV